MTRLNNAHIELFYQMAFSQGYVVFVKKICRRAGALFFLRGDGARAVVRAPPLLLNYRRFTLPAILHNTVPTTFFLPSLGVRHG